MKNIGKSALAGLILGLAGAATAHGQVSCGAVVTGKAVLTGNLSCFTSPAFTIDGGDVDMDGHWVACLPGSNGIVLTNSGGKLRNGFVSGCDDGVILAGSGKHAVTNVLVKDSGDRGFVVLSPKNKLVRNTALGNATDGFKIASAVQPMAQMLVGNVSADNGQSGFDIAGDGNKLTQNIASGNGAEGFLVVGDGNKLSRNTSYDNTDMGFELNGTENSLSLNNAIGNNAWGFAPYGEAAKVKGNLALDNNGVGFGSVAPGNAYSANVSLFNGDDGYLLFGAGVVLARSAAIGNGGDGFQAALAYPGFVVKGNRFVANGAMGINMQGDESTISGNTAIDNGTSDADDLNTDCDTNTWKKNVIGDATDACIE